MKLHDRLVRVLRDVRARDEARRDSRSVASLLSEVVVDATRRERFVQALSGSDLALIAECKRSSPSVGALSTEADLAPRMHAYAAGGAAALSILTEPDHFRGSLDDLCAAPEVRLPRLRKDFLLDARAVVESWHAGADAVLLIARCLPGSSLAELRATARDCGLAVLVEIHDEHELERAVAVHPEAIGVNARDLSSFQVDLDVVERLLPAIPAGPLRVAESGMSSVHDLRRVRAAGADAALVGSALMRSDDPAATLCDWRRELDGE